MKSLFEGIAATEGPDVRDTLIAKLHDIIVKTLCMPTSYLTRFMQSQKPDDVENQLCFAVMGFDFFIDGNYRPFLINITDAPSMKSDFSVVWDYHIKKGFLVDLMKKLGLNMHRKNAYLA